MFNHTSPKAMALLSFILSLGSPNTPAAGQTTLRPATEFSATLDRFADRPFHSDIAFFETIFSHRAIEDDRLPFLLANAYILTSQHQVGMAFFEHVLQSRRATLSDRALSTHLAAYALIRADYAVEVNLFSRLGWVSQTFELLEEADDLADGQNPLVHWAAGVIYAQVPGFFGKRDEATHHLTWLAERPETEPLPGFYREAYRHLGQLADRRGDRAEASRFHALSGYGADAPDTLYSGWFATSAELGLRMSPTPWVETIAPDEIYAVRGHGFSDIHFVISTDRSQLIAIDAGTQPFSFESALAHLEQTVPDLPPLRAVLVTHAHWDHIGGYTWVRANRPEVEFYGRENYAGTLQRAQRTHPYEQLRSEHYEHAWISDYSPDHPVSDITEIELGGSRFRLVPVTGGETEDALLVRHEDSGTVFGGDTLMPFYGEPTVDEGFVREAISMMDATLALNPSRLLHGHYGITVLYGDRNTLAAYRDAHAWLVESAGPLFETGHAAEEIIRMNLTPPSLLDHPDAFLGYLAARDHIIRRLGDDYTGIWREDSSGLEPRGLDTITRTDRGRALELYFGLSASQTARAIEAMLENGDLELALETAVAAEDRFPNNPRLAALRQTAADRLRGLVQFFDPFRFTIYTQLAEREHPPMPEDSRSGP
ncbi:MBL fold metallo-hydrolase [uncultured Maricaulis sp.]|uniref:MBL fold metallo-hydrolase n=1 Tax=uncultured Maricaulis sp. TaxID=174710 RepID=UPI00262AFA1E|nr:MBL fold metallo-hydrolase [uncultured Maricaulis sp.]